MQRGFSRGWKAKGFVNAQSLFCNPPSLPCKLHTHKNKRITKYSKLLSSRARRCHRTDTSDGCPWASWGALSDLLEAIQLQPNVAAPASLQWGDQCAALTPFSHEAGPGRHVTLLLERQLRKMQWCTSSRASSSSAGTSHWHSIKFTSQTLLIHRSEGLWFSGPGLWKEFHPMPSYFWLVVDLPLWKIWVRQLEWWHSQYMQKKSCSKPPTSIYIHTVE